ncbi:MAG: baseplate J/gp47 family protein [Deltaproteobacteria bacterium]|nr:baseplate J/gp47 family protein [Deltaproteobacteria bacterium]
MSFGVTITGFVEKTLEQIKTDIFDDWKANISAKINTTASSWSGVIVGIMSSKLSEVWEMGAGVYSAFDPDEATGDALTGLAALTGTIRRLATESTAAVDVVVTQAVNIAEGTFQISVTGNPAAAFVNAEAIVAAGAGTVADVAFEAVTAGATVANAATLTVIDTPTTGAASVTNPLDATIGAAEETDAALRLRREADLSKPGTGTVDAIRADLLNVSGVTSARVFENDTDATDGDGLPPHSIEALVLGGAAQDVVDQIWASKGAGIQTYGASSGTAEDSVGDNHTVNYTRPTEKRIYLEIDLTTDADYPVDGDAQVATAAAALVQAFVIGDDFILAVVSAAAFGVSGVVDVTAIRAGFTISPVGTVNLSIGIRELATLDTSDIVVA